MERPFPACNGDQPYAFVSYAHEDAAEVYPLIKRLHHSGIPVWYDEGIAPASSWRDALAEAIEHCDVCLYFITPRSARSEHCLQEVNFAIARGRPLVRVDLAPTRLPPGLELTLGTRQALIRAAFDAPTFEQKLHDAVAGFLDAPVPAQAPQAPAPVDQESIAILPLEVHATETDTRYLADGIVDELVRGLVAGDAVRVVPPNTLATHGGERDPLTLARAHGVAHVLTGRLQRAGARIRLQLSLARTSDGTPVWVERLDRDLDDFFALQDEIAVAVLKAVSPRIAPRTALQRMFAGRTTQSTAAFDAYMRGYRVRREAWGATGRVYVRGHLDSLEDFRRAAELDPDFAEAHVTWTDAALEVARVSPRRREAMRAEIVAATDHWQQHHPGPLTDRSLVRCWMALDVSAPPWPAADDMRGSQLRVATCARSVLTDHTRFDASIGGAAYLLLAQLCATMGCYDTGLAYLDRVDPTDYPFWYGTHGNLNAAAGRTQVAIPSLRRIIDAGHSADLLLRRSLCIALARAARHEEAQEELRTLEGKPNHALTRFYVAYWQGDEEGLRDSGARYLSEPGYPLQNAMVGWLLGEHTLDALPNIHDENLFQIVGSQLRPADVERFFSDPGIKAALSASRWQREDRRAVADELDALREFTGVTVLDHI